MKSGVASNASKPAKVPKSAALNSDSILRSAENAASASDARPKLDGSNVAFAKPPNVSVAKALSPSNAALLSFSDSLSFRGRRVGDLSVFPSGSPFSLSSVDSLTATAPLSSFSDDLVDCDCLLLTVTSSSSDRFARGRRLELLGVVGTLDDDPEIRGFGGGGAAPSSSPRLRPGRRATVEEVCETPDSFAFSGLLPMTKSRTRGTQKRE